MKKDLSDLVEFMKSLDVSEFHLLSLILSRLADDNFKSRRVDVKYYDFIERVELLSNPKNITFRIDEDTFYSVVNKMLRTSARFGTNRRYGNSADSIRILEGFGFQESEDGVYYEVSDEMMSLVEPLKAYCKEHKISDFFDNHLYQEDLAFIKRASEDLSPQHLSVLLRFANNFRCLSAGMFNPQAMLGLSEQDCKQIAGLNAPKKAFKAVLQACGDLFESKIDYEDKDGTRRTIGWLNSVDYNYDFVSLWGEPILTSPLLFLRKEVVVDLFTPKD